MTAVSPAAPLDLRCELDLGGAWTDVSSYVYQREGDTPPVSLTRGRGDESSQANPGSATWEWNNRDGRFSPKNPLSPYYGQLGRNTPVRWSVPAQNNYLRIEDDTVSGMSCPDAAGLRISGDIDIRVDLKLTDWQGHDLAFRWGAAGNQSWLLSTTASGALQFWWSTTGSDSPSAISTLAPPVGRLTYRATLQVSTGTVTFYTGPPGNADSSTGWTQLGSAVVVGATSVHAGTATVDVGGFFGRAHELEVRSGIGGTVVAHPVLASQAAGATSFADAESNTWSLIGTAEISSRDYRWHGLMSAQPPKWDVTGADMAVAAQAGGPLRLIGQGQAPLVSPMKRALQSQSGALAPVALWPCEDLQGSTAIGSATGGPLMMVTGGTGDGSVTTTGPAFAASTTFLCSNALPTLNGSAWYGQVPAYTSSGSVIVRFLMDLGTIPSGIWAIVRVITTGTVTEFSLRVNTASELTLAGYNASGTVFSDGPVVMGNMPGPVWVSMELQPGAGGTVNYSLVTLVPGAATGQEISGSFSGSVGNVTAVYVNPGGQFTDTTVGQISVQSAWESLFDLYQPLNAWTGETAAARLARLAAENGWQARIIGAPAGSALMGAQAIDTLENLLQACEDADRGQIYEPRQAALALGYRTLGSMCGQAVALALDYGASEPGGADGNPGDSGLDPTYDDQLTRNDWTLTRTAGSGDDGATYQYQLDDGSAMSISPPPAGVGDYADTLSVNVQTDAQLPNTTRWMVHVGTVDEARWPAIPLNLARPETAALHWDALDTDIGDLVEIDNAPDLVVYDPVRQLAFQQTERLGGFHYAMAFNAVPESPYETGIFDDPVYGRADTDGSSLAAAAASTATSLSVYTAPGFPPWTPDAADFPFDVMIAGERITALGAGSGIGAFLADGAYGATDWTAAYAAWQALGGPAISVSRAYYTLSDFGVPLRTDVTEMIAAGVKICVDLQPAYDPVSSADLAAMTTFLQALQSAGAVCDVSLWHEPYYAGLSSAQYTAMIAYYGPTVRSSFPLAVCLSGTTDTDPANGYYPAAADYDLVAVDAYAGSATTQITNAAAQADTDGKPFGIWEFNGAIDSVNGQSQAAVTTFFEFLISTMAARAAAGKPNADLILFSSGNANWLGTGLSQAAGAEGGTGNWQNSSNCTIAQGGVAHSGSGSLQMTANAAGSMIARHCNSTLAALTAHAMPVAAGQIVAASAWFQAAATARSCQVPIIITDASANVLSTTFGTAVADTVGGWTQVVNNVTAPASAAWAVVETEVVSAALGEVHYADDVYLGIIPASNDLTQALQFSWDYRFALLSAMHGALDGAVPQRLTVTRSVNGVVKSQAAGADVRLWFPPIFALA